MRKVMLLKRVETKSNLQDDCEATFHQWGTVAIEGPNGCFTGDTIAVCEKADGTVVTPFPTMIRFLDKACEIPEKPDTCRWTKHGGYMVVNPHSMLRVETEYISRVGNVCQFCGLPIEVVE
jgi:hypothetical protein